MSRFNTSSIGTRTMNQAGGQAFAQTPLLGLISVLLTSFGGDTYYERSSDTFGRLKLYADDCDPKDVAKAAIYARTQFGMRSITHAMASQLAGLISGQPWAKNFFDRIVYRPDDMMEILAYHKADGQKIPNSMKKGFAAAFDRFSSYQLAKYRGEGKAVKLVDVVNLVHPVPVVTNGEALKALVNGTLKSFDTWEVELSKPGADKIAVWTKLLRENKLGYFALLRNLRNIAQTADAALIRMAADRLADEKAIRSSLVLPFRFTTAYSELEKAGIRHGILFEALDTAIDLSLANVPQFDGNTLVALDVSGSMQGRPQEIGTLFAAALVKTNKADLITFDGDARYVRVNTRDTISTIVKRIPFIGGSTDFNSVFHTADRPYDRIIILSDMQAWVGGRTPTLAFSRYKTRTGANPTIYSFDLTGSGTMQFPEKNVMALAGFSEKIFDIMKLMESDKNALIQAIRAIEL